MPRKPKAAGQDLERLDRALAGTLKDCRAGQHCEFAWELFRLAHFPGLEDLDAAELLGRWCARHGLEPDLQERKVDAGSKVHVVRYLVLRPQK